MLDLLVFAQRVDDGEIEKWERKFLDAKMIVKIHPNFSFSSHTGFLPFRIHFKEPAFSLLGNKDWLSGFEININDYNFEDVKKKAQPKKTFIKSLFSSAKKDIYVSEETDNILSKCNKVITISWGTVDSLELRMAVLSSAILAEIFNGVCFDPQEGRWDVGKGAFEKFLVEVNDFESSRSLGQWKLHGFETWI